MKKTALLIMILTLFSKIIGFGREIILSYFFGVSNVSDAYLISLTIPGVLFGLIGTGIGTAYIPMETLVVEESGEAEGFKYTSNFTNIVLIIITILLALGMIFTEPIVKIFAIGFVDETLKMAISLTRISLWGMYFTALVNIFSGYLQIKNNYIIPALVAFPLNVIVIISIVIASQGDYVFLAIGTLVATASQFLMMIPFIKKQGFKYSFNINFKDIRVTKTLWIALPVIIGTSINQINTLVDKTVASSVAVGGISALNYANMLNTFVNGIIVVSIVTAMYPMISSYANSQNYSGIKKALKESINIVTLFILPVTFGALIFNKEIVHMLFGRGAFDSTAIDMTSNALFFYAFGMLGSGLREVLARGFYSMQNTKTPMINSLIGMLTNIILNIILSRYLGIGGLALATSIAATVTTLLLFISLRKELGSFGLKEISISFLKFLGASLIMGGIAKITFNFCISSLSQNISLLIAIVVGAILYFVIIYFMKIEDVDVIVGAIKNKFAKNTI